MKSYVVTIGGLPHTVQLDDVEARRRGLLVDDVAQPAAAAARAPEPARPKSTRPANKARAAANKA